MNFKYFSLSEFDCPSLPDSGVNMDSSFLLNLNKQEKLQVYPLKSQVVIEQKNTMPKSVVYQIHPTLLESQQILLCQEEDR
jgi:hypothetical protein